MVSARLAFSSACFFFSSSESSFSSFAGDVCCGGGCCSKSAFRYPTRSLRQSSVASQLKAALCTVRSCPSGPWIALSTIAVSSTARQIGPSMSMVQERAMAPVRGTNPNVGRKPVVPHRVDGEEIDPSVSEPMANATQPADVAEADPADDPLDPCSVFQGLRVMPPNHLSPCASAPSVSLATSTAPAASSLLTTVASSSNFWSSNPPAPQVVRYPFTASKSFAPQGSPCSGPRYFPAAISRSASFACANARSSVSVITKCSSGSYRFKRARYIWVRSVEETLRVRTSSASCRTE